MTLHEFVGAWLHIGAIRKRAMRDILPVIRVASHADKKGYKEFADFLEDD